MDAEVPPRGDAVTMPAARRARGRFQPVSTPVLLWLAVLAVLSLSVSWAVVLRARRARRRWPVAARASNAVGDTTCLSCHADKATFARTAHRLTMRSPARDAIIGSFRSGENVLQVEGTDMHFRVDSEATGFYQSLIAGHGSDSTVRRERVAYVA